MKRLFLLLVLLITQFSFSSEGEVDSDPWEKLNRKTHSFNMSLDDWLIRPIAETYDFIIPDFVQTGFSNVFDNLGTPVSAANNLIQFKPVGFISETSRFVLNTTFGIFGLFDVASRLGIQERSEDFGQSLGILGLEGRSLHSHSTFTDLLQ
jgi:phospholipid-binding lipoprotein MlaA